MRSEWREVRLEDVAELTVGYVGTMATEYQDSGVKFLRSLNVRPFEIDFSDIKYISEGFHAQISKSQLKEGDVIIVRTGQPGASAVIPAGIGPLNCSDLVIIHPDESLIDPLFLCAYINISSGVINSRLVGAVQQHFNVGAAKKMIILLPEIETQRKIGSIIKGLNEKKEINEKINDNLLQQAQALYTETFITNADPSWALGRLADLIIVRYGKDHKKLADGHYPVYGSGGIMRYVERPLYERESVLIPRKGTLNNVIYVNEPFWSVDTMFYTEMKEPNIAKFVFHFVKSKDLASMNAGSAVPSMTTDILNALELPIPDTETLKRFEQSVAPMYRMVQANCCESAQLGHLRDTLLPKLMSGEIDVSSITL